MLWNDHWQPCRDAEAHSSSLVCSGLLSVRQSHVVSALIQWPFCVNTTIAFHSKIHTWHAVDHWTCVTGNALEWWLLWWLGRMEDDKTSRPAHMDVGLHSLPVERYGQNSPRTRGNNRLWAGVFLRGSCPLLNKGECPEPLLERVLTILSRHL